jgi:hypothetical protein
MNKPPDIERINELTRRLEAMCREAQYIRERIANLAGQGAVWPHDRANLFEDTPLHSRPQGDEDRN